MNEVPTKKGVDMLAQSSSGFASSCFDHPVVPPADPDPEESVGWNACPDPEESAEWHADPDPEESAE